MRHRQKQITNKLNLIYKKTKPVGFKQVQTEREDRWYQENKKQIKYQQLKKFYMHLFFQKNKQQKNYYNILSTDEKKEAIEALAANPSDENFEIQSHKYNTTIRNLKRWFNQGYVRKSGCGRKRVNPQAVAELEKWILCETKKEGKKITRDQIKSKALEIFNSDTFKASKMWMDKFLSEYDIKFKVQTILQEQGCLSKLQEVKFKQEQQSRREKESESLETKRLIKKESQEQIKTDLNVKQVFEEKVYVEDFFLDQVPANYFSDSYEIQSGQNQVELQQFSEQFIPKLEFLGDNYEDIFAGYKYEYLLVERALRLYLSLKIYIIYQQEMDFSFNKIFIQEIEVSKQYQFS
ncbi:unnamed protein product [Paramecium sonneborni]|uniref:HTH CENPB-type domain-containing protein n=1 Tax=Paramecium sonneborni TaxID=65129 RepID=A0A8S1KRP1_9CILI|nr:unnamed protein product [Paramecium sonneborni]